MTIFFDLSAFFDTFLKDFNDKLKLHPILLPVFVSELNSGFFEFDLGSQYDQNISDYENVSKRLNSEY